MWAVTLICLAGNALNVKKNVACFYVWMLGNVCWLAYDIATGLYSRATLDLIQTGFAVWGIIEWTKERRKDRKDGNEMKEVTRVITYQVTEILQGADELTATLTAEQLREKAQEMKETLGVDDVVIERQQVFITGGGRMTVNEMCSRCQHGIYCACAGSQDHYCGNYSPRYA